MLKGGDWLIALKFAEFPLFREVAPTVFLTKLYFTSIFLVNQILIPMKILVSHDHDNMIRELSVRENFMHDCVQF